MVQNAIYLLTVLALAPFSFIGIVIGINKLTEFVKVRMGHVKTILLTPNFRLKFGWSKPSSKQIVIKGRNYSFDNKAGYIWFNGNTPTAFFDEGSAQQLNLAQTEKPPVDPDHWSNLLIGAFMEGMVVAKKQDRMANILLMIAIGASVLTVLGMFGLWQQLMPLVRTMPQIISKLG